jgi:endonuclease/exonuclease/phosphatase (EEP) superfamily protein YafD
MMLWLHLLGLALLLASLAAYLARSGFPLELLAHWRPHLLLGGLALTVLSFLLNDALLFGTGFTTAFAAAGPLWLARGRCRNDEVGEGARTLVWCNVWQKRAPVDRLAELARDEGTDIVALSEPPLDLSDADLGALFPEHPHIARAQPSEPRKYDARLIVLSRAPLAAFEVRTPDRAPRKPFAVLRPEGSDLTLILAHASTSAGPGLPGRRDASFEQVAAAAGEAEGRWLALGDFNAAPWTPDFDMLPGRRLGPCFRRTWRAFPPFYGLPLDHALVGPKATGEMRLGPWIGSDHRPLIVRVA